jgi:DNA-directed RNA polymerase specialized sigma24 family protein
VQPLSPQEADTLFQNIVHILTSNSFHKLRNVKTVDQVEATVLRETRKSLCEYLKREGTPIMVSLDSPDTETVAKRLQSRGPEPDEDLMQREHLQEMLERFRSIMREELTPQEQIVVKLRLMEGWETGEIAEFIREILKHPMEDNNVNIIFHRAKTKLAKRLVKDVQEEKLDRDSELMKQIVQGRLEERKSPNTLSRELNRCANEIEELYKRFMKKFANYLEELFAEFPPLLAETGGDLL